MGFMTIVRRRIEERFWEKVDRRGDDECWEWTASRRNGYGQLGRPGHQGDGRMPFYAHRLAVALTLGIDYDAIEGYVLHRCHNRGCCNPKHLVVGTQKENMREAIEQERLHFQRAQRDSHGCFLPV